MRSVPGHKQGHGYVFTQFVGQNVMNIDLTAVEDWTISATP